MIQIGATFYGCSLKNIFFWGKVPSQIEKSAIFARNRLAKNGCHWPRPVQGCPRGPGYRGSVFGRWEGSNSPQDGRPTRGHKLRSTQCQVSGWHVSGTLVKSVVVDFAFHRWRYKERSSSYLPFAPVLRGGGVGGGGARLRRAWRLREHNSFSPLESREVQESCKAWT